MTREGPRRVVRPRALPLALAALIAASPAAAGAHTTRPAGAHAHSRGVGVAVRHGPTYHPGYGHGYGYHYPYYPYRPYAYPYYGGYPWYGWGWGWGGYWPSPPPQRVYLAAHEEPGVVETDVRPKKSEVRVDGAPVGQARDYNGTWDRLGVPAGRHTIEFRASGYRTLSIELDVEQGAYYLFDQKLQKGEGADPRSVRLPSPAPVAAAIAGDAPAATLDEPVGAPSGVGSGFLRVRARPADAVVYLDGEFLALADELGRLHGALSVAPGRHVLEVGRPGYATTRVEVDVARDATETVEIELGPE